MPFANIAALPDNLKKLPKHAQEIYMNTFNSAFKTYDGNEGRAHGAAWVAVKKGYKKNANGQWVAKESSVKTGDKVFTEKDVISMMKEGMSDNDRRQVLQAAVTSNLAVGDAQHGPWIRDVYDTEVVYEIGSKMFKMAYVIDSKGKVVFGQAERVTPHTVYTPVAEAVEAKISELTLLASEREDNPEVKQSLDSLLDLLEKEELSEEIARPLLEKADEVIANLAEAKAMKTEEGEQYPQSAFAYAPDNDPKNWKLRLWENTIKKVTQPQLGKAAATLSPGGLQGHKLVVAEEALPGIRRAIRVEYRKLGIGDDAMPKWVREENESRERVFESCEIDIAEVTKDGISNGIVPVRIIKPGFNSSKARYYSEQAVNDAAVIFEGAKMYADHPTEKEERERPERSIRDWVATLHETKVSEAGNAVGVAHINAGWLKEKIKTLFEQGDLQHLGTSINAVGRGIKQSIEGIKTTLVERLVKSSLQSVDFVTEAGAGGEAGLRESAKDNLIDVELVDIATFRDARPDLIEAIESGIRKQINMEVKAKMDAEARIKELENENETLTTENSGLKEAAQAAEKAKVKEAAQVAIKEAVDKAELPQKAKDRLVEAHKGDESAEGIEEAIKSEVDYVAALTEKSKPRDLGPSGGEGNETKVKEELTEAFTELTGSKEQGKVAAAGR